MEALMDVLRAFFIVSSFRIDYQFRQQNQQRCIKKSKPDVNTSLGHCQTDWPGVLCMGSILS